MKKFSVVFMLFLFLPSSLLTAAFATTPDEIAKKANTLIRTAEKEYFNGKNIEAAALLQAAHDNLEALKAAGPTPQSTKTLWTKYERLKERVDKKLGVSPSPATAGTETRSASAQPSLEAKLSQGARNNLKKAASEMDFAEKELAKGEKGLQEGKFNLVESYIYNAGSKLESAEGLLGRVINSNQANPDHPEVAGARQRHQALREKLAAFTVRAHGKEDDVRQAAAQVQEKAAAHNEKWLPLITPFTEASSSSRLQYPGSYNAEELARQEKLYAQAEKVLAGVETDLSAADQPQERKRAVADLRFTLELYENAKNADTTNRLQPIENSLSDWERRFDQNKSWNEKSDQGLFIISRTQLEYQKKKIDELLAFSPASATEFSRRLQALENENSSWTEKKRRWRERPQPFPKAGMVSNKLEDEMRQLLADRNIKAKDLVIIDKDWWVQPGEFRYVTTAVLAKDNSGKYWSKVSFRQIKTVAGYGPTEIWDIDAIKIRLP